MSLLRFKNDRDISINHQLSRSASPPDHRPYYSSNLRTMCIVYLCEKYCACGYREFWCNRSACFGRRWALCVKGDNCSQPCSVDQCERVDEIYNSIPYMCRWYKSALEDERKWDRQRRRKGEGTALIAIHRRVEGSSRTSRRSVNQ
jgi:hypothetical protein